jgi:hypothetical protein
MGTPQQHLSEHPWDDPPSSTGGAGCPYEPFQLEKDGSHWYFVSISQVPSNTHIAIHFPVASLLKRWNRLQSGLDLSADSFDALTMRQRKKAKPWLKAEQYAQLNRHKDSTLMDIYDTAMAKGADIEWSYPFPANGYIQLPLAEISNIN